MWISTLFFTKIKLPFNCILYECLGPFYLLKCSCCWSDVFAGWLLRECACCFSATGDHPVAGRFQFNPTVETLLVELSAIHTTWLLVWLCICRLCVTDSAWIHLWLAYVSIWWRGGCTFGSSLIVPTVRARVPLDPLGWCAPGVECVHASLLGVEVRTMRVSQLVVWIDAFTARRSSSWHIEILCI